MPKIEPRHPYLGSLEPYEPPNLAAAADRAGVDEDQLIRLVANENPYGPSPLVAPALGSYDAYHLHPDYGPLKEALAHHAGVSADQVVLSNGADEMIDLLIRLFVEPGETVVISPPTFGMYRYYARVNRCRVLAVPKREDLSLDPAAIERRVRERIAGGGAGAEGGVPRILFLVSPGNPGGRAVSLDAIERLLQLPLVVVVDEAYIAFGGESALALLADHQNLVIVRTFSKWAGMAGLRLGYAALAPRLAHHLERIRPPYNVNAAAMVAALATFADLEAVEENVARVVEERERLRDMLGDIPWLEPLPSQTNFLLCRVLGRDPGCVVERLLDEGILIRGFSDPVMADYIRISIGTPQQNDALLEALLRSG